MPVSFIEQTNYLQSFDKIQDQKPTTGQMFCFPLNLRWIRLRIRAVFCVLLSLFLHVSAYKISYEEACTPKYSVSQFFLVLPLNTIFSSQNMQFIQDSSNDSSRIISLHQLRYAKIQNCGRCLFAVIALISILSGIVSASNYRKPNLWLPK